MKRNRIIYAILWVLSLVGISFFGGPVSYGFFTLMTLIPVVSFLYLLFVSFSFRIYQELEGKNLVAGHTVPFYFILKNEFPFGFSGIRVRFFSDLSDILDLDDDVEYELQPKTGIKKQTKVMCKYRGEYEVGIKSIEIRDYFCLLRRRFNNKETLRVIVKPAVTELTGLKSVNVNGRMTKESNIRPTEPDVLIRNYEEGDDIRFVDWRSSAKTGQLQIRKMTGEEREGISIIMPVKRYGENPADYLPIENKMLEVAIALSFFFLKKNTPVNAYLACGKENKRGGAKKEHFQAVYDWFSSMEFRDDIKEEEEFLPILNRSEIYRSGTVFLVVHKLDSATLVMVNKLHEQQIPVVIYRVDNYHSVQGNRGESGTENLQLQKNEEKNIDSEVSHISIPNVEVVSISSEADLKEVM